MFLNKKNSYIKLKIASHLVNTNIYLLKISNIYDYSWLIKKTFTLKLIIKQIHVKYISCRIEFCEIWFETYNIQFYLCIQDSKWNEEFVNVLIL